MTMAALRWPAEWEAQSAILLAWPHHTGDYADSLSAVEYCYQCIAKTILEYQQLIIICKNAAQQKHIQSLLPEANCFVLAAYNDIWVRDTAALTIVNHSSYQLVNFQFNGWGQKYPHQDDNSINQALFAAPVFAAVPKQDIDMVLEGGSIETDGLGSLLTTRHCLLNSNRNPHWSQQRIEQKLQQVLGIKRFLWLDQPPLAGDDTDAHIDTLARFCSAKHIAYSSCNNPDDRQFLSLKNMQRQLKTFVTVSGDAYQLTALPLPAPIYDNQGQQLPANYCNFLIINQAVLVPVYDDPMDAIAIQRLSDCFPGRKIIAIDCLALIQQYGSVHCMTMQFPKCGFSAKSSVVL